MKIEQIIDAIQKSRIRITDHAVEEAQAADLIVSDVYFAVCNGEIIEDYPNDKPYPSCLIFGQSSAGLPIHSVWAYNEANNWAVLITVYSPDPNRWINFRKRIPK